MPDILKGTTSTIAKQWEKETEANIDNARGRDGSKLKENTEFTKSLKGLNKPVLIDKGWLYQSIKAKGDTLSMNRTGWINHKGIGRPKRPFIGVGEGHPNKEKNSEEVLRSISKDIGKALKK